MKYKEYLALVEEMKEHDRYYYDLAKPVISDYEYDRKMRQLLEYEKEHPEEVANDSPARRVAEAPTEGFVQRAHIAPMMSLSNTYSEEEVGDFLKRVEKLTEKKHLSYCCELKMDGTSISLTYKKGKLVHALTRGNGKMGDDVTANIKTIRSVPLEIDTEETIEVRGEVYMALDTFQKLNAEREEEGLEPFANPRNAAAGSLKLLDSKETAKRKLHLIAYAIPDAPVERQSEVHRLLKKWGFPVADKEHMAVCQSLDEVMAFAGKIHKKREHLPFEIDGIVIKLDEIKYYDALGATGKAPRYAVAYKFAPEQATTRILDITVQVGRTGVLTPVAELDPVFLSGSTISRATLHNAEEVARKDIRIGDLVVLEKAGDVIPQVVKVAERGKEAKVWHMPEECPICHSKVRKLTGEVAVRCTNTRCAGQHLRRIIYFASKQALDIEHMGEKVVEQLVTKGLVTRPADIYSLNDVALGALDGFKEKSTQNLLASIEKSKHCSLARFIMALGIPHVGIETAEALADFAGDVKTLLMLREDELLGVEGVGEKTAGAIALFLHDPLIEEEIALLLERGVTPSHSQKRIAGHSFLGKTFVLTGTLPTLSRDEAAGLIKERGGKVSGSVSKKTDYLLLGEEPGSKYDKAKELKVPLLSEEEFRRML